MHEYSVACEIFENVIAVAEKNGATEVKTVTLELGRLAHINPEQIEFCFGAIAEGSIAEGAEFNFEMLPLSIACECGYKGDVDESKIKNSFQSELLGYVSALNCPACGKSASITSGREVLIKTIEIEK